MKNHKGVVATMLTLGLVVVGTLITLGTSLFVNNRNTNLASNSRASFSCPSPSKCYTTGCTNGKIPTGEDCTVGSKEGVCCKTSTGSTNTPTPTKKPTATPTPRSVVGEDSCSLDDNSCCLTKKTSACNSYVSVYSYSLCDNDMPLSSCSGNSAYGGTLNLCNDTGGFSGEGCYDSGSNGGNSGVGNNGQYTSSDEGYDPQGCSAKGYGNPEQVFNCCAKNGNFFGCMESPCNKNRTNGQSLVACSDVPEPIEPDLPPSVARGKNGGPCYTPGTNGQYTFHCDDLLVCSNQIGSGTCGISSGGGNILRKCAKGSFQFCTFENSDSQTGPAVCSGLTEMSVKGCKPVPSGICSSFGTVHKCFAADSSGKQCAWDGKKCNDKSGGGGLKHCPDNLVCYRKTDDTITYNLRCINDNNEATNCDPRPVFDGFIISNNRCTQKQCHSGLKEGCFFTYDACIAKLVEKPCNASNNYGCDSSLTCTGDGGKQLKCGTCNRSTGDGLTYRCTGCHSDGVGLNLREDCTPASGPPAAGQISPILNPTAIIMTIAAPGGNNAGFSIGTFTVSSDFTSVVSPISVGETDTGCNLIYNNGVLSVACDN